MLVTTFEHKDSPLATSSVFAKRMGKAFGLCIALVVVSLLIGATGYHFLGALPWIDAFLNASMILTGMGPVSAMTTTASKLFEMCYALYSGLVFVTVSGLIMAPLFHRIMHYLHIETGH